MARGASLPTGLAFPPPRGPWHHYVVVGCPGLRRLVANPLRSAWLENRRGDDAQVSARTGWILGYITAFNQYGSKPQGDVSGGKDTEEMAAWIDGYCRHHPADNLYRASTALIDDFKQQTGR